MSDPIPAYPRPEDLRRFPDNWPLISQSIRVRSGGRCECAGGCGGGHRGRCPAWRDKPHPHTRERVALVMAYLDGAVDNHASDNLAMLCQVCSRSYDAEQRTRNRRTKHTDAGAGVPITMWGIDD